MRDGHHPIRWQEADPIMEAVDALVAANIPIVPIGDELEHWQIGDLTFSDDDLWPLAASRGLVEDSDSRRGAIPKAPSPQGARARQDIRPRVLAALTPEPSTASEIAERAGIPGRERAVQATRALEHLEAEGLAFSVIRRTRTRWRCAAAVPGSAGSARETVG